MSADAAILDRIDIRWGVTTRSALETPQGSVTAECFFLVTLGTYAGKIDTRIMADNINSIGLRPDNVQKLIFEHGCPPGVDAAAILGRRGILPEDIIRMHIYDVLVDDVHEIASMYDAD